MPAPIPVWADTLAAVLRDTTTTENWGYWVPEPALIVGSKSVEMQQCYLSNWLRAREPWLYMLHRRLKGIGAVAPQWWRDFLHSDLASLRLAKKDSRTAKRKMEVYSLFSRVFAEQEISVDKAVLPDWFGRSIASLDTVICRQVLWELFD